MTEWQSIKTAPRDETRILLWRPGIKPFIGFWSNWNRWWTDGSVDASRDHVPSCVPTHWQPVPEPHLARIEAGTGETACGLDGEATKAGIAPNISGIANHRGDAA